MKYFSIEKTTEYVRQHLNGVPQNFSQPFYHLTIEEEGFDRWGQSVTNVTRLVLSEEEYYKLKHTLEIE
jgi:hypothetical protein